MHAVPAEVAPRAQQQARLAKGPPVAPGYHGYWPISSSRVDRRFGDEALLKRLIDTAHAHGINVLLDYVANHVHQEHPLLVQHPDWITTLDLPDGRKNIRIWDEHRLTTWFDTFMPSLDLERPEVYQTMSDSALFWLEKFPLDGFRHDATKHIPEVFWRTLTRKIKERIVGPQGRSIYQIGETFGSRQLIGSYVGSGMIDAQFDFNFYFDARFVCKGGVKCIVTAVVTCCVERKLFALGEYWLA